MPGVLRAAARTDSKGINHTMYTYSPPASDAGDTGWGTPPEKSLDYYAGEQPKALDPVSLFREHKSDFSGDVQRKISRMRALTAWKKEYCVVSHNFLALFASSANLAVRRCILLSSVQAVVADGNEGTFRISIGIQGGPPEELVLRVARPGTPSKGEEDGDRRPAEAAAWVEEIRRRMQLVEESGRKLLPCLAAAEACRLTAQLVEELDKASKEEARKQEDQILCARREIMLRSLSLQLANKVRMRKRLMFEELALHAKLEATRELKRLTGCRRLARAVRRFDERQLHATFDRLADTRLEADVLAARAVMNMERQRGRRKAVQLGVLVLASLARNWGRCLSLAAMTALSRNAREARRLESEAATAQLRLTTASLWDSVRGEFIDPTGAPGATVQRLRVGGHVLRAALRHIARARKEWALRSWSAKAMRCAEAEVRGLAQEADELNGQLTERCDRLPRETALGAMVLSIRAAQQRRKLAAFAALAARRPRLLPYFNPDAAAMPAARALPPD